MRIAVFGMGYVGCVTAARLAEAGHQVMGVDVNDDKVAMIRRGESPIIEPGLGELIADGVKAGRLRATTDPGEAVAASRLALVCVGTPSNRNGSLDLSYVERAVSDIANALVEAPAPFTIVVRSTILPGSIDTVVRPILRRKFPLEGDVPDVDVAVNPEFIREGCALQDFLEPPFTLVGSDSSGAVARLRELYGSVHAPFVETTVRTAEMIKYACNAFHALKVCFANEVANMCESLGADASEALRIFRMDRRLNISEAYLRPGFAFGGSCLPKDVRALNHAASRADVATPVLGAIMSSNEGQIRRAVDRIVALGRRRIGVVGLAFKPGTDDLRESPLVRLVESLLGRGYSLRVLDQNVSIARLIGSNRRYIETEIPHISAMLCDSVEEFVKYAEVVVIGNVGDEAKRVLQSLGPNVSIVDLTRSIDGTRRVCPAWEPAQASEQLIRMQPQPVG